MNTEISATQTEILVAASTRDGIAFPFPERLKGGAVNMTAKSMLGKGLLQEVEWLPSMGTPMFRETGDGHGVTLEATDDGLMAVGHLLDENEESDEPEKPIIPKDVKVRSGSKNQTLIEMVRRENGATLREIMDATGWQKHTVRGAISGFLKKKMGMNVESTKVDGERTYREV